MKDNANIMNILTKMLQDYEWMLTQSLLHSSNFIFFRINIFDLLRLGKSITRISISKWENMISMLFLENDYDCLNKKNNQDYLILFLDNKGRSSFQ